MLMLALVSWLRLCLSAFSTESLSAPSLSLPGPCDLARMLLSTDTAVHRHSEAQRASLTVLVSPMEAIYWKL